MDKAKRPKCPWIKFYPTDFLGDKDVAIMSTNEVGAYCLLLFYSWQEDPRGTLPDNDRVLARMARMSDEQWQESRDAVLAPFRICSESGRLYQPRMVEEAESAEAKQRRLSEAGKRGASKRWHGNPSGQANGEANGEAIAYQNQNQSQNQSHRDTHASPTSVERYENEPDVQRAWNALPKHRRRGLGGFRDAWIKQVVRQSVNPEKVIESIEAYCSSDEGSGQYARGPVRMLTDEIWNEDPAAWTASSEPKQMDALDALLEEADA